MKIEFRIYEAEYSDVDEAFLSIKLKESKKINAHKDLSLIENAINALGEDARFLVPFNPNGASPTYELDYLLRDNKVNWDNPPDFFTIYEYFDYEKIHLKDQNVVCLVNPSCRGDGGPDVYNILVAIYEEINSLFTTHPFGVFLMASAIELIRKTVFSKVVNYLNIQNVYGANHLKLKKFLYCNQIWELKDLAYKLDSDYDVAEEILILFGYVRIKDSDLFELKYSLDVLKNQNRN